MIRLQELYEVIDMIEGNNVEFDEDVIRKTIKRIEVNTDKHLKITFMDGYVAVSYY